MDIDTIRTPSKGITMFSGHCNFAENVQYASHCCWSWGSDNQSGVTGALGQSTKNSFPVVLRPHVFTRRSSTFETLKSKQRGLLNFYLHQVEGNREINLCRSFLIFEVPNFHSSWQHATTLWLPRQWCLVKEKLSPYDFQQFNISSCTKCISEHPMLVHSIQSLKVARNFSEDN